MTELNLSLWIIGGVFILGVIAYNFWREYKAKKNIERTFGVQQDDVLMQPKDVGVSIAADTGSVRQEPSLSESEYVDMATPSMSEDPLPIDEFIDCIITMDFETPVLGDKILNEIQSFRRVGNKPVQFVGVSAKEGNRREVIEPTTRYKAVQAGVQLVTRSGPINELEYSELVMTLRQIADNLNADPDIPDMRHVIAAGRELYGFVTEHDARLSVNVHSNGAPWAMSSLLAALERHGFDVRPDGRLVMSDGEGGALFVLSTNCGVSEQDTQRITLLLDVPCVTPERSAFNAMVSCAKSLATRLGGTVVDDGNDVLSDLVLNQIQEQVASFYQSMQAAEIPAGSLRAQRVFGLA